MTDRFMDGPYFCLKEKCEFIDNTQNPDFPPSRGIAYGVKMICFVLFQLNVNTCLLFVCAFCDGCVCVCLILLWKQQCKHEFTFNGKYRAEPKPSMIDPLAYYPSYNKNNEIEKSIDLNKLIEQLKIKKKEISDRHINPLVLELGMTQPPEQIKQKMNEYIGARVAHSLIVGRPFVFVMFYFFYLCVSLCICMVFFGCF